MLRTQLNYPLPTLRTLREWASSIDMRTGHIEKVYELLEIAGRQMTEQERITMISYDEVSTKEDIERDRNDQVFGPYKEMQVVMARGLFGHWKQPIYVAFDQPMTQDLINTITSKLHGIGFEVVGCVHDMGGGNVGVHRAADLDYESGTTSMPHPITGMPIFFFADAPHMLKLCRNWLIDGGFVYKGIRVTKRYLEELTKLGSTLQEPGTTNLQPNKVEFNNLYKLTEKHVNAKGAERQNVRKAAQLMSRTNAVTVRRHYGDIPEAMVLADVLETVNDWFDVCNSYKIDQNIVSKRCYGLNLPEQNAILDRMEQMVREIRCVRKNGRISKGLEV